MGLFIMTDENGKQLDPILKPQERKQDYATDLADQFITSHLKWYEPKDLTYPVRIGHMRVEVLPQLKGKPWNNFALGVLHTVRPSSVRVILGEETTDSVLWRVSVYLSKNKRTIEYVEQEVEVLLFDSRFGYDVSMELDGTNDKIKLDELRSKATELHNKVVDARVELEKLKFVDCPERDLASFKLDEVITKRSVALDAVDAQLRKMGRY